MLRSSIMLLVWGLSVVWGVSTVGADQPFETDAMGTPGADTKIVAPWRTITVDAQYGGYWVVAGDVNDDGEIEIVSARNVDQSDNHFTSAVVVQRLNGSVLWKWGDPEVGRRKLHHDVACQIHDLDHDGVNEVIVAGDQQLIVLDGPTGKVSRSFAIPQHASDCVVFADLTGKGWPTEILVKNRYQQIWAYHADGELLWTSQSPGGYRTAHQPLPVDLDGDGRDEILAGYAALNSDGSVRWVFEAEQGRKNGGHADCWRVVQLGSDPSETRLIMTMCGGNALVMTDGHGRLIWKQTGHHYESVDVGKVRSDVAGLQIVVDVDHLPTPPKPLCVFNDQGELLGSINTDYTRHHILIDWDGDGINEIGSALPRGLFSGHGDRVVTLQTGADERPTLLAEVDTNGCGADAVLMTASAANGDYKVYLYKCAASSTTPQGRPQGTGINFTLY